MKIVQNCAKLNLRTSELKNCLNSYELLFRKVQNRNWHNDLFIAMIKGRSCRNSILDFESFSRCSHVVVHVNFCKLLPKFLKNGCLKRQVNPQCDFDEEGRLL